LKKTPTKKTSDIKPGGRQKKPKTETENENKTGLSPFHFFGRSFFTCQPPLLCCWVIGLMWLICLMGNYSLVPVLCVGMWQKSVLVYPVFCYYGFVCWAIMLLPSPVPVICRQVGLCGLGCFLVYLAVLPCMGIAGGWFI
jgi:hypothetical protein